MGESGKGWMVVASRVVPVIDSHIVQQRGREVEFTRCIRRVGANRTIVQAGFVCPRRLHFARAIGTEEHS
jgi:hypothetical protein